MANEVLHERSVDYDSIRLIGQAVQLQDVVPKTFGGGTHGYLRGLPALELSQRIEYSSSGQLNEGSAFIVTVVFAYSASHENRTVATVKGEMVAIYLVKENGLVDYSEEQIGQFSEINGTYNVWPYLRELVSSVMSRMGVPGVMVPLWRAPKHLPPKEQPSEMLY